MKIKDLPKSDRPREKLVAKGAENLKDSELLAILLRTGKAGKNVIEVASQILLKYSKKRLLQMTYDDLVNPELFADHCYPERCSCTTHRTTPQQKAPWLKSGELEDNTNIVDSEEKISKDAIKESSTKVFPQGTVLFAMYGATAGKLGILGIDASTNQAVAGMIPVAEKLNNKFLYYFLLKQREEIISKAWGGAQPNLSQTIIKKFKIPLPPLAEQKKIVALLDSLSEKVRELQQYQKSTQSDLSTLEQAILHKAFV